MLVNTEICDVDMLRRMQMIEFEHLRLFLCHIFFSGYDAGATAEQIPTETKEGATESLSCAAGNEEKGQRICTGDL